MSTTISSVEVEGQLVQFEFAVPDPAEFLALYADTPWGRSLPEGDIKRALAQTYLTCCARVGGTLVGVGRVLSDGLLHAFLIDLIVAEPHRGHRIGTHLLDELAIEVRSRGIAELQLMAAAGRTGFYERAGFATRPADAPGMASAHARQDVLP